MAKKRNTILIVDDMTSNRLFLKNILEDQYELLEAENGKVALELMRRHHDSIAAVLLDVMMPVKDGIQTLEELKGSRLLKEFPILVVTSDAAKKSELRVLDLGASDVIVKPYDPSVVKRRVALMIELFAGRRALESKVDNLSNMLDSVNNSIVNTLATVTEFRSLESGQHVVRIRKFAKIILREMASLYPDYGLTPRKIDMIASASVLHDVGKVQVPDHILNKPGRLTADEFEIMKTHTTAGSAILSNMSGVLDDEYMRYANNICRYHHERWDGNGYPEGLRQHSIPLCAQVVAICDVYDALTTPRVYKAAYPHETAVQMILRGECGEFNPEILKAFGSVLEAFEKCAREYADSGYEGGEKEAPLPVPQVVETAVNAPIYTEEKWRALCQLVDGVIIEADVNADSYRVLHGTGRVFKNFYVSNRLNEMLLELLNKAVHPEDKLIAAEQILCMQREFFEQGLRYISKRFRVRNASNEEYYWVDSICLRVNTSRVSDRKAICVWQRVAEGAQADGLKMSVGAGTLVGHETFFDKMPWTTLFCKQDRWLTIEEGMPALARLLGYKERELQKLSGGRLMELIEPEDREMVLTKLFKGGEDLTRASAEYRLRCKNGEILYVKDESISFRGDDGMEHACKALMDVSSYRREQEAMRTIEDRYRMLLAYADEIFFVWDMERDEATFADNFRKTFGYEVQRENFSQWLAGGGGLIHEEDMAAWSNLVSDIREGKASSQQEVRVLRGDGSYIWCRVRVIGQQHSNGKTTEVLGAITNINTDKMMVQTLKQAAERDALTGLCNCAAAKELVEAYLKTILGKRERAAVIQLDIDNFKKVNDRHGHLMGDAVLMSCGEMLKKHFRPYDVVARMGGDEFMVLVCDVPDREAVESICRKTLARFEREIATQVEDCNISCSLGVAMIPNAGVEMERLLEHADVALRRAKGAGKNCFKFYSDEPGGESVYIADRTAIESDQRIILPRRSLVEHVLHMLYRSDEVEETIRTILALVGRQANVTRAFIFENAPDDKSCSNTFEWCRQGERSEMESRRYFSYEDDLPRWQEQYDEAGVFCCCDVDKLPERLRCVLKQCGMQSMLSCAIVDEGKYRGFVGFECSYEKRAWTKEQIGWLSSLAEVISLFLLKKRRQEQSDAWAEALLHTMANKNGWMLVVRAEDFGLRFVNDPVGKLNVEWKRGEPCYRALMGRDAPCEECPLKTPGHTLEMKCERLEKEIRVKAVPSSWDGENVHLLMCEEIRCAEEDPAQAENCWKEMS